MSLIQCIQVDVYFTDDIDTTGQSKQAVVKAVTLRDIENSASRRKHRIEMKFNTHINKNERFI